MLNLLLEIFNILLVLVGSAFLIIILIAMVQVPFKQKKQNKIKKELFESFSKLNEELEKAIKEQIEEDKNKTKTKKDAKKTKNNTKTKEEK